MNKVKIGEITNPINGKTIKSSDWTSRGIPIIRIQNLNNRKNEFNYLKKEIEPQYMVDTGELLFAWSGTIGAFFWEGPRAALNQHIFRLPIDESKTDKNYFYYSLNFIIDSLKSQMQGSAGSLMHITKSKFIDTEIPYPPLAAQKIIANKIKTNFDLVDQGIHKLNEASRNLQTYKQSILNSAIRGKLVPQDPNNEPTSKLLERIQKEKEKLIAEKKIKKENPLPTINEDDIPFELPKEWQWTRLGNLFYSCMYGTSQKCTEEAIGTPVLRIPNIVSGELDFKNLKYAKFPKSELEKLALCEGDLLVIRSNGSLNLVGTSCVYKKQRTEYLFAGYLIRLQFFASLIAPEYIDLILKSPFGRFQIEGYAKSTSGVNNVNAQQLANLMIPLPPFNEQKKIIEKVQLAMDSINNMCNVVEVNLNNSQKLKQSILKKAFEGEL